MITPTTGHPMPCPVHNAGYHIVASITVPDSIGLVPNRYSVTAYDHAMDNYVTWIIAPGQYGWTGDQGHYGQSFTDALADMVRRAL